MREITLTTQFCIVGGGLAGVCAAIAAAREGTKTVLIHDRPVLGGNASSEIRMHIGGAHGDNNKETGILEEIQLENLRRNPAQNYSIWDSVIYEKVLAEGNITLLLNCSCTAAETENGRIVSLSAWQLTTETRYTVYAQLFADCSGDAVLAPMTGAEFMLGREAKSDFSERIPPDKADKKTMGMSILLQARETDRPQKFIPPSFAYVYETDADLPYKDHDLDTNFWWIELGGEHDVLHDAEKLRDELLKIAFGVWDHIKNRGDHGAENYVCDWIGFLPGKRESRRYKGAHILTQNDIESGGNFDDTVGYGGWSMDDHFPQGFYYSEGHPTIYHPAPSPYQIPYRCLYSANIENLLFAGRNISVTHAALSSTRVMATCAVLGQAAGTAAALALRYGTTPAGVYAGHLPKLQKILLENDCYLPGNALPPTPLMSSAALSATCGDPSPLLNGHDRSIGEAENAWSCREGARLTISLPENSTINYVRPVFDSDLNDRKRMPSRYPLGEYSKTLPACLVRDYEIILYSKGQETARASVENNAKRTQKHCFAAVTADKIEFCVKRSHGAAEFKIFSLYFG